MLRCFVSQEGVDITILPLFRFLLKETPQLRSTLLKSKSQFETISVATTLLIRPSVNRKSLLKSQVQGLQHQLRRHVLGASPVGHSGPGSDSRGGPTAGAEVLLPAYRSFLGRYGPVLEAEKKPERFIKYSAEDLERMLGNFFEGERRTGFWAG